MSIPLHTKTLFHIFVDHYRSSTEYVREHLSMYIKDNKQSFEIISAEFLHHKVYQLMTMWSISQSLSIMVMCWHCIFLPEWETFNLQLLHTQGFGTPILQSQRILHPLPLILSWFIWGKMFSDVPKEDQAGLSQIPVPESPKSSRQLSSI